jgi:hypothetical protein
MKQVRNSGKTILSPLVLGIITGVVVILGVWKRMTALGWVAIVLGILLLIAVIIHIIVQFFALSRMQKMRPFYRISIRLSNLFFFLTYALQIDSGDRPEIYAGITNFYYHGYHSISDSAARSFSFVSNISFIALIVSWVLLVVMSFFKQEDKT